MRYLLLVCALVSAGLLSGPADARSRERATERPRQVERELRQQRDRSAEAARRALEHNGGGRVLSVERQGSGYRVKVLKDGEMRVLHVEAD